MRETVGSLRVYLILVGLFGLWALRGMVAPQGSTTLVVTDVLLVINAGFGAAFIVCALRLKALLAAGGGTLVAVIWASCAWAILINGMAIAGGAATPTIYVTLVLEVLISLYLWRSVKRLALLATLPSVAAPPQS